MIEKLKKKDIIECARVYMAGQMMQVPKYKSTLKRTVRHLEGVQTFVYKENVKIKGLVSFTIFGNGNLKMHFICALVLRVGVGKKLMKRLASLAVKDDLKYIISEVSSKDKRVMSFYESCGFKKYGEHKPTRNFMLILVRAKPERILERLK